MKKYVAIMLIMVLALGLGACGDKDEVKDLVKVGDVLINQKQLDQYVELYALIQGLDLAQFNDETIISSFKASVLEELISFEAMKHYYAGQEDKVFPETIEEDLKNFLEQAKVDEGTSQFLEEKGVTDEVLTGFFYSQYYAQAYFQEVKEGMPTLEADAKKYYEDNKDSFKIDEVTASHILVAEEDLAKEILEKLKGGAKFEDMAAQYGTDGTKDVGGSLGTFGRGQMVPEFEEPAFALKPGELSDIVKTEFGFHIIKVTDKKQGVSTFEEVKASIEGNLVGEESMIKIKELKDDIGVEYLTKEYIGLEAE